MKWLVKLCRFSLAFFFKSCGKYTLCICNRHLPVLVRILSVYEYTLTQEWNEKYKRTYSLKKEREYKNTLNKTEWKNGLKCGIQNMPQVRTSVHISHCFFSIWLFFSVQNCCWCVFHSFCVLIVVIVLPTECLHNAFNARYRITHRMSFMSGSVYVYVFAGKMQFNYYQKNKFVLCPHCSFHQQ